MQKKRTIHFDGKKTKETSVRVNPEVYDAAKTIFEQMGITPNEAYQYFLEATVKAEMLPFSLDEDIRKRMRDQARKRFQRDTAKSLRVFLDAQRNRLGLAVQELAWSPTAERDFDRITRMLTDPKGEAFSAHRRIDQDCKTEVLTGYGLSKGRIEKRVQDDCAAYHALLKGYSGKLKKDMVQPTRMIRDDFHHMVIVYKIDLTDGQNDFGDIRLVILRICTETEFAQEGGEQMLSEFEKPIAYLKKKYGKKGGGVLG